MGIGRKLWTVPAVLLIVSALLSLAVYADSETVLDVTRHKTYLRTAAEGLLELFSESPENAALEYDGKNLALVGKVSSVNEKKHLLTLTAAGKALSGSISCETGQQDLSLFSAGDLVTVYGKLQVSYRLRQALSLAADSIEKAERGTVTEGSFVTADGLSMTRASLIERETDNGGFSFLIPEEWAQAESALPGASGFSYQLRTEEGSSEYVFIFCVDQERLEDRGDITKTKQVQKAIVRNIVGDDKSILRRRVPFINRDIDMAALEADYASFVSYSGHYADKNLTDYRFEFLFLPVSDENYVRCVLYVYRGEHAYADEILLMMRFWELS